MDFVINIPKDYYEVLKKADITISGTRSGKTFLMVICSAIANGKPLPKGHGDLKDVDEILKAINTYDKFGYTETGCFVREPKNNYVPYIHYEDIVQAVSETPTIIEAESEV